MKKQTDVFRMIQLSKRPGVELTNQMRGLMRTCWTSRPVERPSMRIIGDPLHVAELGLRSICGSSIRGRVESRSPRKTSMALGQLTDIGKAMTYYNQAGYTQNNLGKPAANRKTGTPRNTERSTEETGDANGREEQSNRPNFKKATQKRTEGSRMKWVMLQKVYDPSPAMAGLIGVERLNCLQIAKRLWEYIKANNLQNPANKSEVLCDEPMKRVFGVDKFHVLQTRTLIYNHAIKRSVGETKDANRRERRDKRPNVKPATQEGMDGSTKKRAVRQKEYDLSPAMIDLFGVERLTFPQVIQKLWEYIRANNLYDNGQREVVCDEPMKRVFGVDRFNTTQSFGLVYKHALERSAEEVEGASSEKKRSEPLKARKAAREETDADGSTKKQVVPRPKYSLRPAMADLIGVHDQLLTSSQVFHQLWVYIKANHLQSPKNEREILCDEPMKRVFGVDGFNTLRMYELIQNHAFDKSKSPDKSTSPPAAGRGPLTPPRSPTTFKSRARPHSANDSGGVSRWD